MPSQSRADLVSGFEPNNIGAIGAKQMQDLSLSVPMGGAIEVFDPWPESGFDLTRSSTVWGKDTLASLAGVDGPDLTLTPAYTWLRNKFAASTESGHRYFSQVDGDWTLSGDGFGYTYSPASLSLGVVCDLEVGITATAEGATMLGALAVYKTASGSAFGTNTARHFVVPFDTGSGASPWPFYCADRTSIIVMPGETIRVRLEYYGTSGGAATTPVIGAVNVNQFRTGITVRSMFQPYAQANSTEPVPSSGTRMRDYSDMWGKSCGVPLANRTGLT